jgi:phosphoadenosine phosphosulfate reductase
MTIKINLNAINKKMSSMDSLQRINEACKLFGNKIYALSSAGIDSALMIDFLSKSDKKIDVIHINSGFLPEETIQFKKQLEKLYKSKFIEYSPSKETINDINAMRLWDGDYAHYSKLTKLDPLENAIKEKGISALLSGVRSDQTKNRSTLNFIDKDSDGVYRVNPFLDWTSDKVNQYIKKNNLPRNPLYYEGFESVGDVHLTEPGANRSGRKIMECGINVLSGNPIVVDL